MTPRQRELDFTTTHSRPSGTSRDAAEKIESQVTERQRRILDCLRRRGKSGGTTNEVALELGMLEQTVNPRITGKGELMAKGLVVDSGEKRRPRPGARTWACVYVAWEFAP